MQPLSAFNASVKFEPEYPRHSALASSTATVIAPVNDNWLAPKAATGNLIQRLRPSLPVEEQLFNATAAAKQWASKIGMHLDRKVRDRIFKQLDVLHDPEEWCHGDQPVSLSSFQCLLRTIVYHAIKQNPSLSLAPNGNLFGLWGPKGNTLTVEFQGENRVRWLVNSDTRSGPERISGIGPLERLRDVLVPFKVAEWFDAC